MMKAILVNIPQGKSGTVATLKAMAGLVARYKANPAIVVLSRRLVQKAPEKNQYQEAKILFEFVRDNIRYIRDPNGVETLATPTRILEMQSGDCDEQTTLLVSMLESIGIKNRFVVVGQFETFFHVYSECLVNGEWLACDPCERVRFGEVFETLPEKAVYTL